jgi:tetratricopeptide (TPR) repeat protein
MDLLAQQLGDLELGAAAAEQRGDTAGATLLLQQILCLFPALGGAGMRVAILAYGAGRLDLAQRGFAIASHDPAMQIAVGGMNGQAAIARHEFRFTHAVRWLRHALALLPDEPALWSNIADMMRLLDGSGREARAAIRRSLALDSARFEAQVNYLHTLMRSADAGEIRIAELKFQATESADVQVMLADLLLAIGDHENAFLACARAVALAPASAAGWRRTAQSRFAMHDNVGAVVGFRRHRILDPSALPLEGHIVAIRRAFSSDLVAASGERFWSAPDGRFLAAIDDALVFRSNGAVVEPNGLYIFDKVVAASWESCAGESHTLCEYHDRLLVQLPNSGVPAMREALLLGGGDNFSHWINDWSSKAQTIVEHTALAHLPIVVTAPLPGFARRLLERLGVETDRIVHQVDPIARYGRLWLPSMTHAFPTVAPSHIGWLRQMLGIPKLPRGRRRLFLSRRKASYRRILNMDALTPLLQRYGIEEVIPDELSLDAQIELFASAEFCLAPLGGGSAAILLCPDTCKILDLTHDFLVLNQYEAVCRFIGQSYRQIIGHVQLAQASATSHPSSWDFIAPVGEIDEALSEWLGHSSPRDAFSN